MPLELIFGPLKTQDDALNEVLSALVYGDGSCKPIVHRTLKLYNDLKEVMGEANSLFVEALLERNTPYYSTLLLEARAKGCHHPVFYRHLAHCYYNGSKSIPQDTSKALDYGIKAVSGGDMLVHLDQLSNHWKEAKKKCAYLLELEREGYVDSDLFVRLAEAYGGGLGCAGNLLTSSKYHHLAVARGGASGYLYTARGYAVFSFPETVMLSMLEAEERGVRDTSILNMLIDCLCVRQYRPSDTVLGPFKNKMEMTLHYCDVLIERESPRGYYWKAYIHWSGINGQEIDQYKAVAVWQEADRLGLAGLDLFIKPGSSLRHAYMEGMGVPQHGAKALEYCIRAFDLASWPQEKRSIYQFMAAVYEKGISPIEKDLKKADDLRKEADLVSDTHKVKYVPRKRTDRNKK